MWSLTRFPPYQRAKQRTEIYNANPKNILIIKGKARGLASGIKFMGISLVLLPLATKETRVIPVHGNFSEPHPLDPPRFIWRDSWNPVILPGEGVRKTRVAVQS